MRNNLMVQIDADLSHTALHGMVGTIWDEVTIVLNYRPEFIAV